MRTRVYQSLAVALALAGWVLYAVGRQEVIGYRVQAEKALAVASRCEGQLTRAVAALEKAEKVIRELRKR